MLLHIWTSDCNCFNGLINQTACLEKLVDELRHCHMNIYITERTSSVMGLVSSGSVI